MIIMLKAYSKVAMKRFVDTFEQKILEFAQQLHRFFIASLPSLICILYLP